MGGTVTPDGNSFLFKWLEGIDMEEHIVTPVDGSKWTFRFANGVPLNDANYDLKVNFLECIFEDARGKTIRFTWITDIKLNKLNVYKIARGGRARWRIENETFNTLKNQEYEFEHNYGVRHGELSKKLLRNKPSVLPDESRGLNREHPDNAVKDLKIWGKSCKTKPSCKPQGR